MQTTPLPPDDMSQTIQIIQISNLSTPKELDHRSGIDVLSEVRAHIFGAPALKLLAVSESRSVHHRSKNNVVSCRTFALSVYPTPCLYAPFPVVRIRRFCVAVWCLFTTKKR